MITRRWNLGLLLAALCLVALRTPGLAQSSQPPTFRSTIDLLTIDTSVRDKNGQPVPDLQASDFSVTIDGRARTVVSAVFFKADAAPGRRVTGGAAPTPRHVSNDRSSPGRVVVFALDAETIRGGQERPLFDTASRMIEGLSPADAVGLTEMPGPSIELSRDHSAVVEALKRFRGRARTEAEELVVPENMRELNARAHTQQVLSDLAKLVRRMATIRAPRSVILISGGLKLDHELNAHYAELERAAAESRVLLYTVFLDQVGYEVSRGETRPDAAVDPAKADGLATIASRTGGMFFSGIGRAAGVFERIHSEVTSFYQLALETSPSDADGKQHDVKVRVTRPGVNVRSPSHVAVPRPAKPAAPPDPLALALQQQIDVADVPLAVATYNTQPAGKAIRLLVSAEIGAPNSAAPAEWGFAVIQHGKTIAGSRGRIPAGSERPRVVSTSVDVPPGGYQLRVAAVDADDRIGVLEIPITAAYETASGAVLGDLVVGVAAGGQLEPRRRVARSDDLTVMVEVSSGPSVVVGGTLQLIRAGSARSVFDVPLVNQRAPAAGAPSVSILLARASLASVPPGRYTASAALRFDGQPPTQVSRVIEVTGEAPVSVPADVVAVPVASAPAAAPPIVEKPAAAAPSGVSNEIMRRVGAYVEQYGGKASLLVAVEDYSQSADGIQLPSRQGPVVVHTMRSRRLISEFALVPNASTSGGWLGYRDVIEVDGKPVADRNDRLQALLRSDAPDLQEAKRIADEGARYNIGPVSRNFNVPTAALFFFHAGNLSRFTFRQKGRERIEGVDTIALDFLEARMPTLITNSQGKNVPSSGTVWVNPVDGAVVRTRLELREFDDAGSRGVIDVVYRRDPELAMWLPSRMTERYSAASITVKTDATYRDFKRFQTSVKIK